MSSSIFDKTTNALGSSVDFRIMRQNVTAANIANAETPGYKAKVVDWLKRSLDVVKQAHLAETPKDLTRKVRVQNRDATVDGMYLRIIVHANEHEGQLIAYARMTGVVPPWSK